MAKRKNLTLKDIAEKVLKGEKRPLSAEDIWKVAVTKGYDKMCANPGTNPAKILETEIMEDTSRRFIIIPSTPITFYLKKKVKTSGIRKLVNLIRGNPPIDLEDDFFIKKDWKDLFDTEIPEWRKMVRNRKNWPKLEEAVSRADYDSLCEAIVEAAGPELAIRWFNSTVAEQKDAAREYLSDPDNLDTRTWKKLDDDMKERIVHSVFDSNPGEPIDSISYSIKNHLKRSPKGFGCTIPVFGYIPSAEIKRLQRLVERAEDFYWEEEIDEMITERNDAVITSIFRREPANRLVLYEISEDERYLISELLGKFKRQGFSITRIPDVYISLEPPPLFYLHPELEDEVYHDEDLDILYNLIFGEDEENDEDDEPARIRRHTEDHTPFRPEVLDIEELLGCYIPNPKIILYEKGIRWYIKECEKYGMDIEEEYLRAIVLVHEVAHWIMHLLPKDGIPEYPLDLYKRTSRSVHEGWAQLLTWWIVKDRSDLLKVFEQLNQRQSPPYRVFENYIQIPEESVIKSLEKMRDLNYPVDLKGWDSFM